MVEEEVTIQSVQSVAPPRRAVDEERLRAQLLRLYVSRRLTRPELVGHLEATGKSQL